MTDPAQDLAPGFMVVHGNHPESLLDLMVEWMRRQPLDPLEDELVLVQSNGIAQWLKIALADPAGLGIAAAVRTELPSRALWDIYRCILGRDSVPPASALDKPRLVWRLMRLLPALLDEPQMSPLAKFLDGDTDARKRHQLALALADLLDQYQVYRADWLERWARGDDVLVTRSGTGPVPATLAWQPLLWRRLLEDIGAAQAATSRAQVHQRFVATLAKAAATGSAAPGLPRRVTIFGISSMPRQWLEALSALARWCQVMLFVNNPCEHDWSAIAADRDRLRLRRHAWSPSGRAAPTPQAQPHPLLAAWGKQGRDFIRLLDEHDDRRTYEGRFEAIGRSIDLFTANHRDTLLRQLQDDVRELRPADESLALWPPVDAAADASVRFHVAHGPQREVEVLHDQLLAAFAADASLRPRDVVVMVPDVAVYAAHIQAVFARFPADDPRHIPFGIADRHRTRLDPVTGALEALLHLPHKRLGVSEVLDLLDVPAVRRRFGIAQDDLPMLRQWIGAARIRWGLDAQHRAGLGLPGDWELNGWSFGLHRMLLGYAVGEGRAWAGIEPLAGIGGLDAALLGPLARLHETLEAHWRLLQAPATPAAWGERLRALLEAFFLPEEGSAEGLTLLRAQAALDEWEAACADAGLDDALPLPVVRSHWLDHVEPPALGQPFFAGGVTFASLLPMRAIPFRFVALLGMNDGDYPRSRPPADFDLMDRDPRAGDRSRRDDDHYLFLEALMSARERLHVSWVGRSIHDNEARPPSVLVAQLRDHLASAWRLRGCEDARGGEALLGALTLEHRLQPFDLAYFDGADPRLFTYATEWRSGHAQVAGPPTAAADFPELPEIPGPHELTLQRLGRFLKNPVAAFFKDRLAVQFAQDDPAQADIEPFELTGLLHWQLQDELIRVQRSALDAGSDRQEALQRQLAHIRARGELPFGHFADAHQQALLEPMEPLFEAYATEQARWPEPLPPDPVAWQEDGVSVDDWLADLRADAAGRRCRLVLESSSLVKESRWRLDKLLPYWVEHLAANLEGRPTHTLVLSKAGQARLGPIPQHEALAHWRELVAAWRSGMRRPLPFTVGSATAWLRRKDDASGGVAARSAFVRECEYDACLLRAFPQADLFWNDEARDWSERILQPLAAALANEVKA
jgi:exodeoxyribonuclease V gamma subunit